MSKIVIVVSVDWEGRDIIPDSIELMEAFREKHPHIPLQHFLNAAYFTKVSADPDSLCREMRRTIRDVDCLGLHIHPWRTLVEAAGVVPLTGPNIRGEGLELNVVDGDWGHEVALHGYGSPEICSMLQVSRDVLDRHGFGRATEFRSGAWLSGASVTEALISEGFKLDASAANRHFLSARWGKSPLYFMLEELWPDIDEVSQPFLQRAGEGELWQVPNNGCLADYTSAEDILEVFERNVDCLQAGGNVQFMSVGFHQETALLYLEELERGLLLVEDFAQASGIEYEYLASPLTALVSKA